MEITKGPDMGIVETVIVLVAAIVVLLVATQRFLIPYPVVLVLGGLFLGFLPGLPKAHLDPNLIFLLFVAPVIYSAGFLTSLRDFRAYFRPIVLLVMVLVVITTFAVAGVLKFLLPDMPWAIGCILGAIIAPSDAIAATVIMRRLKIPRRITSVLEGESLFNDASALILYRFAVAAVATGLFSFPQAVSDFFLMSLGGVIVGVCLGYLLVQVMKYLQDVIISITVSLLAPFIIYLAAEKIGVSGILALVMSGIVMGVYDSKVLTPKKRIKGSAVWDTFIFLLNALAFVLMGLQFPGILAGLGNWSYGELFLLSAAVLGTITLIRFLWTFFSAYVIRAAFPSILKYDPYPPWQQVVVIAWSGMRGIVSLAAALALPMTTVTGADFPARSLIIFLTFTTIIGTLVLQGITLPILIKWLRLKEDEEFIHEEQIARVAISKAMLAELEVLKTKHSISEKIYDAAHNECLIYAASEPDEDLEGGVKFAMKEVHHIRKDIITAGRQKLIELHRDGLVSRKVTRAIQREFDFDELRLT